MSKTRKDDHHNFRKDDDRRYSDHYNRKPKFEEGVIEDKFDRMNLNELLDYAQRH